jgi:hypothetical protein
VIAVIARDRRNKTLPLINAAQRDRRDRAGSESPQGAGLRRRKKTFSPRVF